MGRKDSHDFFETLAVGGIEGCGFRRVDVEHSDQLAARIEDGHDDFRARARVARDVTRESMDIGDDLSRAGVSCNTTDTVVERNLQAADGPLVRADAQEIGGHDSVKTRPTGIRQRLVKDGATGSHHGNRIGKAFDQLGDLFTRRAIEIVLDVAAHG